MELLVTHETRYRYRPMVEIAQHVAYMRPNQHAGQQVLQHTFTVLPQPSTLISQDDVYGNQRCFFSLQTPHEELSVRAHSQVLTQISASVESDLAWEKVRELFRYQAGGRYDAASEFVFASPFVPRHEEFASYARPSFSGGANLLKACIELMERMHSDFTYESHSTQINTPALQALAQRKGVCQDFAHIMVACLRSLGLAARYVSGYLLTEPPPGEVKLVGSDASHAWASVYLADLPEGARWVNFDPTNNRWGWHAPGPDYVTVAVGRDFGDVSPLRGVIHGGASHTLTVGVTVQSALAVSGGQSQSQSQSQSGGGTQSQSQSTII
jgi:transglutaminase-like putative cysteine protease